MSNPKLIHFCIPTAQNTINLFSLQYLEERHGDISVDEILHILVSTETAIERGWCPKLKKSFEQAKHPHIQIINICEEASVQTNFDTMDSILSEYRQEYPNLRLIYNIGGGLKQMTVLLYRFHEAYKGKENIFIYPDKGRNRMIAHDMKTKEEEYLSPLRIPIPSKELLKLYLREGTCIEKSNLLEDPAPDLVNLAQNLPDLYQDDYTKDLLFLSGEGLAAAPLNEMNVNDFFYWLINDKKYKKNVLGKIAKDLNQKNGLKGVTFDTDFKASIDKTEISQNLDNFGHIFKNVFWNKKYYLRDILQVEINEETHGKLSDLGLNPPPKNNSNLYDLKYLIANLFKETEYKSLIKSHGDYFEYHVLQLLYHWATKNPEHIRDISFDINLKNEDKKEAQIDCMIYTHSGSIYYIECKTYEFGRKNFMAALPAVSALGGIFNRYIIVVPPLPSDHQPELKERIRNIYKQHDEMTKAHRNVSFCQISPEEETKSPEESTPSAEKVTSIKSFESVLDGIIKGERRKTSCTPNSEKPSCPT